MCCLDENDKVIQIPPLHEYRPQFQCLYWVEDFQPYHKFDYLSYNGISHLFADMASDNSHNLNKFQEALSTYDQAIKIKVDGDCKQ